MDYRYDTKRVRSTKRLLVRRKDPEYFKEPESAPQTPGNHATPKYNNPTYHSTEEAKFGTVDLE
jgi:hypothetical protein